MTTIDPIELRSMYARDIGQDALDQLINLIQQEPDADMLLDVMGLT